MLDRIETWAAVHREPSGTNAGPSPPPPPHAREELGSLSPEQTQLQVCAPGPLSRWGVG